jgi:hypothetical protein
MKAPTVLGMNLSELSIKDIKEEIIDLKKDLIAIQDYEDGLIGYAEFRRRTMFNPCQKEMIIDAIEKLREEKVKRVNGFYKYEKKSKKHSSIRTGN